MPFGIIFRAQISQRKNSKKSGNNTISPYIILQQAVVHCLLFFIPTLTIAILRVMMYYTKGGIIWIYS